MTNNIRHSGVVESIEGDCIKVRIVQTSACRSCKNASSCSMSESKEKIVDVYEKHENLVVGNNVWVVVSQRMGYLAVLFSAIIPLLIIILVLMAIVFTTGDEVLAALISLASLIPYYIIIYLARGKIRKKLSFHIEKYSD